MSSINSQCPCGSGLTHLRCCGQYHSGEIIPETAEQLMRSRYTAYVNNNADYLVDTIHPEKITPTLFNELLNSFKGVIWSGLEISEMTGGGKDDDKGTVSFSAYYETAEGKFRMDEKSLFVKIADKWYYKTAL
ncbi:MAG: YchJ family protein [Lentisphaeraceae bacterium]|nr:YchJ family protein [Lentisphaeraceae bacterium]